MTISYTGDVANASSFGCFNKILLKWRGSVYKLIYKELLFYISLYMLINIFYREILVKYSECTEEEGNNCRRWKESREIFESLRTYCSEQLTSIPLTFVLGFYVSLIVTRWWNQYSLLPWPDTLAILVMGFLVGKEDRQRLMRRNIVRYSLLSYCMCMRTVSFRVKKRFPDLQHLVDAGLMRDDELKVLQDLDTKVNANKWFLPLVWATDICARALAESAIRPQTIRAVVGELVKTREQLTGIINHDWVSVPLVYTQVVTLAVYSYFGAALIGAQWIMPENEKAYKQAYSLPVGDTKAKLDLFYPFFLTIQFAFFFGWLKVAETLINPFGEDDDDFELNRLIDRHIQVGYLIVDHEDAPELLQDKHWAECIPKEIPYTIAAEKYKKEEFVGSAEATLAIKESDKEYSYMYHTRGFGAREVPRIVRQGAPDTEVGDYCDYGDYEDVGTPIVPSRMAWLKGKMNRLDSIRSNRSISSSSTYIYGHARKPLHKSQLSLYDKISRKISLGRPASRKSSRSRQRSLSDTGKPRLDDLGGGVENRSFDTEEIYGGDEGGEEDCWSGQPDLDLILDKKLLETITENQNSPYSTQASHCKSRRESAQSIFASMDPAARRGSLPTRESTVLELFHENELEEELEGRRARSRSHSLATESLGSHRSRESGVGSLGGDSYMEPVPEEAKARLVVELPVQIELKDIHHPPLHLRGEQGEEEVVVEEQGSPSPFLPKRKAVISLAVMDEQEEEVQVSEVEEKRVEEVEEEKEERMAGAKVGGERTEEEEERRAEEDIGSPFEWMDTVYV